jgi:hypothetical protein
MHTHARTRARRSAAASVEADDLELLMCKAGAAVKSAEADAAAQAARAAQAAGEDGMSRTWLKTGAAWT